MRRFKGRSVHRRAGRYVVVVGVIVVANFVAFMAACSDDSNVAMLEEDAATELGPGISVDAADVVQPYKPDGAQEFPHTRPGACLTPDASKVFVCDYDLICVVEGALDGGKRSGDGGGDGGTPAADAGEDAGDVEVDSGDGNDRRVSCAGVTTVDASPCGTFACGPGCECQDPDLRICMCQ